MMSNPLRSHTYGPSSSVAAHDTALPRLLPQALERTELAAMYLLLAVLWGIVFYVALLSV